MVTKLSSIQEKFNNPWESNHNPEKKSVRKLKRERNSNKRKSENKLKRKKNNLEQRFWINYNKINRKLSTKREKECKPKMMSMTKICNMIGSFVMTVARLSINKRLTTNAKNVKTTCYVRNVMTLSFISILYIKQSFLSDSEHLSNQSVQRYYQNYNHVKHVDDVFHKPSNISHAKTGPRMSNFCVIDAMIKAH